MKVTWNLWALLLDQALINDILNSHYIYICAHDVNIAHNNIRVQSTVSISQTIIFVNRRQ